MLTAGRGPSGGAQLGPIVEETINEWQLVGVGQLMVAYEPIEQTSAVARPGPVQVGSVVNQEFELSFRGRRLGDVMG